MSSERAWWRNPLALTAAGAAVLLVVTELALGRASGAPSDGVLFLGRFHPLVVHLPIGIFVLLALGELATLLPRQRSRIDPVTGLVLPVLVLCAVVSFVLGHFLARSGDFPPQALGWHRRLAFVASLGSAISLAAWVRQVQVTSTFSRWGYRAVLFGSLAVLSLGAHFGGTMTRGETYLSKYAPGFLKPLLGGTEKAPVASSAPKAEPVSEPRLLEQAVMPILEQRCVSCHGPEKVKGGLRLDTLAGLEKGGESGPAIVKGAAASSLLVKRLHLPLDDDERMPPKDKPQLSPEQIALIEFWIERGATNELKVRDLLAPVSARSLLEKALEGAAFIPATGAPASSVAATAPEPASAKPEAAEPASARPEAAEPASAKPEAKAASAPAAVPLAGSPGASDPFSILAEKCEKCHGEIRQKGKLRVDSLAALLAGGSEGPSVVAGHPEKSPLIQRVRLPLSSDEHMPPSEETQLTAREVATLSSFVRGLSREARPTVTLASTAAPGSAPTAIAQSDSPGGVSPPASDAPAPPATGQPSEPAVSEPEKAEPAPPPAASATSESAPEPAPRAAVNARGGCAACAMTPRPQGRAWAGATLGLLAFGWWRRSRRER